jgi:hypothetical protein
MIGKHPSKQQKRYIIHATKTANPSLLSKTAGKHPRRKKSKTLKIGKMVWKN